jgi:hypothetical protein
VLQRPTDATGFTDGLSRVLATDRLLVQTGAGRQFLLERATALYNHGAWDSYEAPIRRRFRSPA